jgi:hypothetical protein
VQRLAVVKSAILNSPNFWFDVIARHGAAEKTAREFYKSAGQDAPAFAGEFLGDGQPDNQPGQNRTEKFKEKIK